MTKDALKDSGAALIELLIVIPLLLILTAGMVNIGFVLWQTQLLFDAARYGAREGVFFAEANPTNCEDAGEVALRATERYIEDTLGYGASRWRVAASVEEWRPTGPRVRVVQVDVSVAGDRNCLFCIERIAERVAPEIKAFSPIPPYCT